MIRLAALIAMILTVAACDTVPLEDTPTRAQIADSSLPPMKAFASSRPTPPARSNGNIAADFLSLHFELESGRDLGVFTRFEGPITVKVIGTPPAGMTSDLRRLLARLRNEAGIDIRQIGRGDANVTIEAVSRAEIRRALPQAACFVVPNVASLDEFRRNRRKASTNWSLLEKRERLGIFVPSDASPQEVRDCLHEELAQAIGPLNDLYRLTDSVFNDDNVHTILTGFDMLILRATYAPELRSGMTRAEVAARLPSILARLNPAGRGKPTLAYSETPRSWKDAVQTALGPGARPEQRRQAAENAARIAQAQGWQDHRRAFSHYMLGRMIQVYDPQLAQQHYASANYYLSRTPGTALHRAYVATQTAAFAIASGNPQVALSQVRPAKAVAARAENASLLATLMLLEAEALELQGNTSQAQAVRLDSLGWARYGFGSDWAVRAKMQEIASLSPRSASGG